MAKKVAQKTKTVAKVSGASNKTEKGGSGRVALRPLGDRIVVRPLTEEETGTLSAFGIIIPDTATKEKPEQGIVIAVGPGKYDDGEIIPVAVSVGDRVLFSKYGYDEVTIGGEDYFIVNEGGVLAVIKE